MGKTTFVEINENQCCGCILCMKVCPTKAIRIRDGSARIEGVCINCLECMRVCPQKAIKPITTETVSIGEGSVVCPSSVLYSQFGEEVLPNDILLGLKSMNFGYVHDLSYTNEVFNYATELYIKDKRREPDPPFPIISPCCPVVVRLIAYRFPSLIDHILPLATPKEIAAREARKRFSQKKGIPPEDISVIYVSPCPAMMIYISSEESNDKLVGINSIYSPLQKKIESLEDDNVLHYSGGIGIAWSMSGGETMTLKAKCIAVSGVHETIRYLQKIEMGLLKDVEYIEFRICPEGCIGGPFTVEDKYIAKRIVQRLVWMFGMERRIKYSYVAKLYKEGWFESSRRHSPISLPFHQMSISERFKRQKKVEEILSMLPHTHCSLCGAPDCNTFAEDVADGKASIDNCIWMQEQKKRKKK